MRMVWLCGACTAPLPFLVAVLDERDDLTRSGEQARGARKEEKLYEGDGLLSLWKTYGTF
jgi:hypothetical protein